VIHEYLESHVVGQDDCKKALAIAYSRLICFHLNNSREQVEKEIAGKKSSKRSLPEKYFDGRANWVWED